MSMIRGRKFQSKTAEELEMEKRIKGLKKFGDEKKKPTAGLKQQRRLSMVYCEQPQPVNVPIPDVDPFYEDQKTFLFLNSQKVIFRFSDSKSLFIFDKDSRVRRTFLRLLVHAWFNYIVIATILINCLVMMINGNNKPEWSETYVENVFLFIYTTEAIVKIVGRGFILHKFSYLRDPWNWLDFVVIVSGFVLIVIEEIETTKNSEVGSLTFLRAIRVLRIFKTVSVIPGLRMIVSALVASTIALKDAMMLSLMGFSMFSLIGIQLFRGTLRSKCVLRPPWMLPDVMSAQTTNGSSKLTYRNAFTQYGSMITKSFGVKVYHEMEFLMDEWLSSNASEVEGSVFNKYAPTGFTTDSKRETGFTASAYGDFNSSTYSGYGSGEWTYSKWTYRIPSDEYFNDTGYLFDWDNWITDKNHYVMNGFVPLLCGNASNAQKCPVTSICVQAGLNPNFDYTSFDNFLFAFLSVFRLSLQDNWEELYLQVLETSGHLAVLFFLVMIFLGSYYLVNLILAVVASSYEDQRKMVQLALAEEKKLKLEEKEYLNKRRQRKSTESKYESIDRTKNKLINCYAAFKNIMLEWTCCVGDSCFCVARAKLKKIFIHPNAEMAVVGLVILNTLFMALEHEPKTPDFERFMTTSNLVFNTLFTIEMVGKMIALSPYHYFIVTWNTFDFVVVSLSLIEMIMADSLPDGLAVLRTFRLIRLVRILKLARSWPTLSKIMSMIADSLSKLGYLTLVLLIVLIIFALAGMQTVGGPFYMDTTKGIPLRWHMNDFVHSFLIVFRVQCGEWIQSMWSCLHSVSEAERGELVPFCLILFLGVVFVGNLVVLNLFLALLLSSFSGADLNSGGTGGGPQKFLNSIRRARVIARLTKRMRRVNSFVGSANIATNCMTTNNDDNPDSSQCEFQSSIPGARETDNCLDNPARLLTDISETISSSATLKYSRHTTSQFLTVPSPDYTMLDARYSHVDNASSKSSSSSSSMSSSSTDSSRQNEDEKSLSSKSDSKKMGPIQSFMNSFVQHWIFETFIIFCIMCSSIALVFEDVNLPSKPTFQMILEIFDKIFLAIFFVEMIMKWIGFGLKKYFTNGWCILDFFIVMVSLISLALEIYALFSDSDSTDLSTLRVLRSLRAFRPLRAMSRFKGIKVVTDALFRSIPSILNVFIICLIFWLVFAIMGVNLFAGKMWACRWKETGEKVWHPDDFKNWKNLSGYFERPPIDVHNRSDCEKLAVMTNGKVQWKNLYANFDNVGIAYVSLMQIATFKGWMPIMYAAVDVPAKIGDQPVHEQSVENYFFFVAFIIFGAFFTLNLFISVVIDNFNQQKSKFEYNGGGLFMTDTQRRAYDAMKKLTARSPGKLIPIPKQRWRRKLYFFVTRDKFELSVLVLTMLNLTVMAIGHDRMSTEISDVIEYMNYGFLIIFVIEILLRIIASGVGFFRSMWNLFDFLVIGCALLVNIISLVKKSIVGGSLIDSPWLPMLRMIRVARILRIARVASGLRTLLFALVLSLPALFNVGSLLFLFVFIYAIFGMSQFGHVEHKSAMTEILNFETFPNAFMLLFQASTSAGWDGFLEPTLYTNPDEDGCIPENDTDKGTCMKSSFIGFAYFISYLIITFVIITNMYIAIILENFDLANKDSTEPLTADDFEHYFDVWQKYDKDGSGQISIDQLSNLLHNIDRPLKIEQPNIDKIASLEIPMNKSDQMHILDVATSLIKHVLGPYNFSKEMESEVDDHLRKKARRLMRNYSRERNMTSFEYAQKRKLVRQDALEKIDTPEIVIKNATINNNGRSEISIVLHPVEDDDVKIAQSKLSHSYESYVHIVAHSDTSSENSSNSNSSTNTKENVHSKLQTVTSPRRDMSVLLWPEHDDVKTASLKQSNILSSVDETHTKIDNSKNTNANSCIVNKPRYAWSKEAPPPENKLSWFRRAFAFRKLRKTKNRISDNSNNYYNQRKIPTPTYLEHVSNETGILRSNNILLRKDSSNSSNNMNSS